MFKIQSISDSQTVKELKTIAGCKTWFRLFTKVPSDWKVVTPTNEVLLGKDYQTWSN